MTLPDVPGDDTRPEQILGTRWRTTEGVSQCQVFVRWTGLPDSLDYNNAFQILQLGDKLLHKGKGMSWTQARVRQKCLQVNKGADSGGLGVIQHE
jgi:hypothetical protein